MHAGNYLLAATQFLSLGSSVRPNKRPLLQRAGRKREMVFMSAAWPLG